MMDFSQFENTHDLRLGDWGPYSKKYIGLSHIAEPAHGLRFDLCAAPGFYRRKTVLPNVRWECGYHPWECSGDLSYFSHRHELEWKDRVYCDISFSPVKNNLRLMRCEMVNNSDSRQNLTLHLFASMQLPPHEPVVPQLPEGTQWVDGLSYTVIDFAQPSPQDSLVWDGLRPGQVRAGGMVGASGIGGRFGSNAGDRAVYTFHLDQDMNAAGMLLRFQFKNDKPLKLRLGGCVEKQISVPSTGGIVEYHIECGRLFAGPQELSITCLEAADFVFDGIAVGSLAALDDCLFVPVVQSRRPSMKYLKQQQTLFLKYPGVEQSYGLWWSEGSCVLRQHHTSDLEPLFYDRIHNHVSDEFDGPGDGHYSEIFIRPLVLEAGETRVVYALMSQGDKDEVAKLLQQHSASRTDLENLWQQARASAVDLSGNDDGEGYVHGQKLMAATALANCVYPAYAKGKHIRHHTPGRWWDSLYSWDSGFIGLGLLELDFDRALDNLNAYLCEPGDNETAFIHHGSPVPVQHYLFLEMWNRRQDKSMLEFFYPRLKQYHQFLVGELGSSDTLQKSGLLKTWSYFYNSGGWDDYPPQHYYWSHCDELAGTPVAVVNTAHAIRTAKILCAAAQELGLEDDVALYEKQIAAFTLALEEHSWDETSGYYSYVMHSEGGEAQGIFKHESGQNFNMGLDGLSPLVADVCAPERREGMYEKLESPERFWTPIGISTVDQSAKYYQQDGYWNGAVWMPHQWFFWKSALDHGKGDFAWKIAQTALKLWEAETENSYNCFEHFIIASGRGAGWHQFGGLSTPVLCWYGAYFRPGRINGGLNCWVVESEFAEDFSSCTAKIRLLGSAEGKCKLLVTLAEGDYAAQWNGQDVPLVMRTRGCCEITLDAACEGTLMLRSIR